MAGRKKQQDEDIYNEETIRFGCLDYSSQVVSNEGQLSSLNHLRSEKPFGLTFRC